MVAKTKEGFLLCPQCALRRTKRNLLPRLSRTGTLALWCLSDGMALHSLRSLMGLTAPSVLQTHLALAGEDIERAHKLHSPVDTLSQSRRPKKKRAIPSRDSPSVIRSLTRVLFSRPPSKRGVACQTSEATAQEQNRPRFGDKLVRGAVLSNQDEELHFAA